jgi:mannitol-specific phosphotransferase system IIBC component
MYSLCRHLAVSQAGSVIGGLSYTLGGFLATADWPQLMNAMIWGPLALR